MVGMRLQGGVEVDLLGKDDFDSGLQRLGDRLRPSIPDRTLHLTKWASTTMPGSGAAVLDFGGPPSGALWEPLWITMTGPDDHTSLAGSKFAIYLGGEASANPSPGNLWIPGGGAALPTNVALGGKDSVCCHFGDNVYALIYLVAGDTALQGTLRVREVHPSNIGELNFLG